MEQRQVSERREEGRGDEGKGRKEGRK